MRSAIVWVFLGKICVELIFYDFFNHKNYFFLEIIVVFVFFTKFCSIDFYTTNQVIDIKDNGFLWCTVDWIFTFVIVNLDVVSYRFKLLKVIHFMHANTLFEVNVRLCPLLLFFNLCLFHRIDSRLVFKKFWYYYFLFLLVLLLSLSWVTPDLEGFALQIVGVVWYFKRADLLQRIPLERFFGSNSSERLFAIRVFL